MEARRKMTIQQLLVVVIMIMGTMVQGIEGLNYRPIIGVMAQPPHAGESYGTASQAIIASYVKWLESAGARVVPFFYNISHDDMTTLFNSINGIVMPGGEQTLNPGEPFYDASLFVYNLALEANAKGDYFPIWGTCQGFQFLNIAASTLANESALSSYDSWDYSWALDFTPQSKSSRMFGSAPSFIYEIFATQNVTMNWHHFGISPNLYKTDSKLSSFFDILSTNVDVNGSPFVSSVEEFSVYEWDPTADVSHTGSAIAAMNYLAQFFVSEVRKNNHHFPDLATEMNALIYNWAPNFTESITGDLQTYYFQ